MIHCIQALPKTAVNSFIYSISAYVGIFFIRSLYHRLKLLITFPKIRKIYYYNYLPN